MKWTEHRRVGSTGPCELEQVEGMETEPGSVSWSKLKELRLNQGAWLWLGQFWAGSVLD